jgi:hypothetical protein
MLMKRFAALLLTCSTLSHAAVKLPAIISDHMVLQADTAVPIWGWADQGEEVSVSIASQTKAAKAGADGRWSVKLDTLKAGAIHTLTVKGRNTLTVNDVLIGEVWLASGQSNMAFQFSKCALPPAESAAANLLQLRLFTVKQHSTRVSQKDCQGQWVVCTPETVQSFSAVAYFFGRDLHQKLKTPVGLINASWGGTDIAAWTSEPAQAKVPALKANLEMWAKQVAAFDPDKAKTAAATQNERWKAAVAKAKAAGKPLPRKPRPAADPAVSQNHPANLFNGMIRPLVPFTIKGVIWYQGEHNCSTLEKAKLYATQLPLLVQDWRQQWHARNLPFAWVQLPGYMTSPFRPQVREAMLKSLSVPSTGMAITVDVGEANNNHPKNKKAVGERLSLWAQARVYRQDVPAYSGPLPAGHDIKGSQVFLKFDHAQTGLQARGEPLSGFQIAGADKQWKAAQAQIMGRLVMVTSPGVKQPVAVRYSWSPLGEGNLFNGANLPASPFRTDDWEDAMVPTSK